MEVEKINTLIFFVSSAVITGLVCVIGWILYIQKKDSGIRLGDIYYMEGLEIARSLLKVRYQGVRGYLKPYTLDPEFHFHGSLETLTTIFASSTTYENPIYVQRILDDLAPGRYRIVKKREKIKVA